MQSFFSSSKNRSILLLVFSSISILVLLGRGVFLLLNGLIAWSTSLLTFNELGPDFLDALSMFLCASLLFPLVFGCIRQLQGRDLPAARLAPIKLLTLLVLFIIWVALLAASSLLTEWLDFGWLLSAPAFLLAILVPVVALAWVAAGGLVSGSRRRQWAAFGLGMTGGTALALILEYALVAVAVVIGVIVLVIHPELLNTLYELQAQIQNATSMEQLLTVFAPYLTNPWVFLVALLFAAGLGPLIEEAVKPLAVWILGRRLRSASEGFALGALSGAGFALLEGLMAASSMIDTPYFGLPARLASSMMHIALSAIVGWGIASALLEKRRKRLFGMYALAVLLHGLWNGSALLAVYGALRFELQLMAAPDILTILTTGTGVVILGGVFLSIVIGLPLLNRRLRRAQGDIIAPLASQTERNPDGLDTQGS